MADYREISQEYAKQGINTAFLLNGGAAVALLSQAAELRMQGLAEAISTGMLLWALGTAFAAFTWITAFASTRYVDKSIDENDAGHMKTSNIHMLVSTAFVILSIGLFVAGCWNLSQAFAKPAT